MQFVEGLPPGVQPQISPQSPTGEIFRYTLSSPKDALGRDIYTLNDLKALQDWMLEREFRRVPRIIDIVSCGGTVKRYEVHPDPERLGRYGITLDKLQNAISQQQRQRRRRLLVQGENGAERPRHRPDRRRAGPHAAEVLFRPRIRPKAASFLRGRGGSPAAADPPDRDHVDQQPADPRRGRGRRGPAALSRGHRPRRAWWSAICRGWAGSASAGRRSDADGNEAPRRQGQRPVARRGRQGAGHRAAAQGRGVAAGPARRRRRRSTSSTRTPAGCCRACRSSPTTTAPS